MNPQELARTFQNLELVDTRAGAAVLLVEHNVDVVAAACDELVVLNFGEVIASGPTSEVLRDPAVRSAYLGRTHARDDASRSVASDA